MVGLLLWVVYSSSLGPGYIWAKPENIVLTLEEARTWALKGRPEMASYEARVKAAEARVRVAGSAIKPRSSASVEALASPGGQLIEVYQVSGRNADGSPRLDSENIATVSGRPTLGDEDSLQALEPVMRFRGRVGLEWQALDFGRTAAVTRAARAEKAARAAEMATNRDELLDAVDDAYFVWLGAVKHFELLRDSVLRAERRAKDLEEKQEIGVISESDILPVRYSVTLTKLRAAAGRKTVRRSLLALQVAVGLNQKLPIHAYPDMNLLEKPPESRDVSDPQLIYSAQAKAARSRALAASRALMPSLGLKGALGFGLQSEFSGSAGAPAAFPYYEVGLVFSIPVWDGGKKRGEADAAEAEAQALVARAQAEVIQAKARAERETLDLTSNQERVELAESLVSWAAKVRADVESRLAEGASDTQVLEQADERMASAQAEWLDARLERARLRAAKSSTR